LRIRVYPCLGRVCLAECAEGDTAVVRGRDDYERQRRGLWCAACTVER